MTTPKNLRIVFMGTPDFAVETLKALLENNYNVVGVITAPDRKSGRGQKLTPSAVKVFAQQHNLNILQPTNLKKQDFLDTLKALNANLQIVVAFRMLPKQVWQMPKYGTFNLHASLLPQYRGAAPIHWAIINGEEKTGVTTFFIDEKIDTGEIILNQSVSIPKHATVGVLHNTLMEIGSQLVIETVKNIAQGTITTKAQPEIPKLKTAYKLNRDNCKLSWNSDVDSLYNKIRGLNPFPAAWCYLTEGNDHKMIKIFDVEKVTTPHNLENGSLVIDQNSIKVACRNGYINIKSMQLPGKRKMDVKSLLNGYTFSNEAKLT